jgi:predicted nucleic acid-binding protein
MICIYFDVCCLNRPFDDQAQSRIRLESEAVLTIMQRIEAGELQWVGSEILEAEIDNTPDPVRRERVGLSLALTTTRVELDDGIEARAAELESLGFHAIDALHLASAEAGKASVLLTTDDKFLNRAARLTSLLQIQVENPLAWLLRIGVK